MQGLDGAARAYHLIPRAASKARAVARHMQARGYAPEEVIAVGDSREDLGAAAVVGTFWLVANALEREPGLRAAMAEFSQRPRRRGVARRGRLRGRHHDAGGAPLMLDARRALVFAAVVEAGSFSAAAAALHLSQPSVSRAVAELERSLGLTLLRRRRDGLVLTDAGERLLERARIVAGQLDRADEELTALRELADGRVRLGAFPTAARTLAVDALRALHAAHPGVRVELRELPGGGGGRLVVSGELDVAVQFDLAGEPPALAPDLEVTELLREPLRLAVPRSGTRSRGGRACGSRSCATRPGCRARARARRGWCSGSRGGRASRRASSGRRTGRRAWSRRGSGSRCFPRSPTPGPTCACSSWRTRRCARSTRSRSPACGLPRYARRWTRS